MGGPGARPYRLPMRIAFVSTSGDRVVAEDLDRPHHARACAAAGLDLEHPSWRDASVDWGAYDLLVLRSPWDYAEHVAAFTSWLAKVEATGRVHNPPPVVRWNLDKRYLAELRERGVPVIPTRYAASLEEVGAALAEATTPEVVVKPVVSAGSRNTGRFTPADPAARELGRRILGEAREVMVQPFAASVAHAGEVSLVLFDGELSHAFHKGPLLAPGGGLLGGRYQEKVSPIEASPGQREVARCAGAAVREIGRERFGITEPLLYARFDVIELDDGSPALLEAELFEPSFFLFTGAGSAERFAAAVERRARAARRARVGPGR